MTNVADLTNTIRLSNLTSKSLLGATFAQAVYSNNGGAPFTPPGEFKEVKFEFTPTTTSSLNRIFKEPHRTCQARMGHVCAKRRRSSRQKRAAALPKA